MNSSASLKRPSQDIRRGSIVPRSLASIGLLCSLLIGATAAVPVAELHKPSAQRGFEYVHESVATVPWSIHVFKMDRSHHELAFHTTMGNGHTIGMGTVSQQIRAIAHRLGNPIAAVNGDFYSNASPFFGDPEGLQIIDGEVVSAPSPRKVCFWIDAQGNPCHSNVVSKFHVAWPDGGITPIGLNEERTAAMAVLYTAAAGPSTGSAEGGVEIVLENSGSGMWLPLEIGQTYTARIRSIRRGRDTAIATNTMVLSLGLELSSAIPRLAAGNILQISTATTPDLKGVETAIGGGPTLVSSGRAHQWSGFEMRHPRTAIGWNDHHIFLVVVDGRQRGLSVGMTLSELAAYMVKIGCAEAMNLDGGGSATMWILGGIANSPSEGHERPAANALVVVQRPKPGEATSK